MAMALKRVKRRCSHVGAHLVKFPVDHPNKFVFLCTLMYLFHSIVIVNEHRIRERLGAVLFPSWLDPERTFCPNRLAKHVARVREHLPGFVMGEKLMWNLDNEEEVVNWLNLTKDSPEKGCLMCVVVGDEPAGNEDLGYMIDPLDFVIRLQAANDYRAESEQGFLGLNTDLVVFQRKEADNTLAGRNFANEERWGPKEKPAQYVFQPCSPEDLKWYEDQKQSFKEKWGGIPALRMEFIEDVKKVVKDRVKDSSTDAYSCPAPATIAVMLAIDRCPWVAVAGVNEWFHVDPAFKEYRTMKASKDTNREINAKVAPRIRAADSNEAIIDFEFLRGLHRNGNLFWNMTGFART